jgi:hypothetical protein
MPNNDMSTEDRPTPVAKKRYEKPTFRYEKVFVTTALSCGKVNPTQGSCTGNGKS